MTREKKEEKKQASEPAAYLRGALGAWRSLFLTDFDNSAWCEVRLLPLAGCFWIGQYEGSSKEREGLCMFRPRRPRINYWELRRMVHAFPPPQKPAEYQYQQALKAQFRRRRFRLFWRLGLFDEQTDDPTLRRCIRFSREWQYGGLEIVNLFAFRTPHPHDLHRAADPIGSENDQYLATAAARAAGIILAWGEKGSYLQRDRAVLALLSLYRPGSTRPVPYLIEVQPD